MAFLKHNLILIIYLIATTTGIVSGQAINGTVSITENSNGSYTCQLDPPLPDGFHIDYTWWLMDGSVIQTQVEQGKILSSCVSGTYMCVVNVSALVPGTPFETSMNATIQARTSTPTTVSPSSSDLDQGPGLFELLYRAPRDSDSEPGTNSTDDTTQMLMETTEPSAPLTSTGVSMTIDTNTTRVPSKHTSPATSFKGSASHEAPSTGSASHEAQSTGSASHEAQSTGTASHEAPSTGSASPEAPSTGSVSTAAPSVSTAAPSNGSTSNAAPSMPTVAPSTGSTSTAAPSTGSTSTVASFTGSTSTAASSTGPISTMAPSEGSASTTAHAPSSTQPTSSTVQVRPFVSILLQLTTKATETLTTPEGQEPTQGTTPTTTTYTTPSNSAGSTQPWWGRSTVGRILLITFLTVLFNNRV